MLFWDAYPRPEAKRRAATAYAKVIKAGLISEPDLLAKTKAFAASWATKPADEQKYIPHAATWLNDGRFNAVDVKASQTLSADRLTDEQWQLWVKLFRQGATQWPDELGPKPGQPGCRVPPHVLIAPVPEVGLRPAATPVQPVP